MLTCAGRPQALLVEPSLDAISVVEMPNILRWKCLKPIGIALFACLAGCHQINAPYAEPEIAGNVLFTSFQGVPKFLDPVSSYGLDETPWVYQAYEPPLHYAYLKRPYTLEPETAQAMPQVVLYDQAGHVLPDAAPSAQVAYSIYTIHLQLGIRYQPHPAFARDGHDQFMYQDLTPAQISGKHSIWDFPLDKAAVSTRVLTADDYVYEIKRIASPWLSTPSPIYSLMAQYIVGLQDLGDRLRIEHTQELAALPSGVTYLPWHDLRNDSLEGAKALDANTLEIRIKGSYPQFKYWLAQNFLSPVPWEAERFYAQRGMAEQSLSLNTWPVGTGAFMLTEQGPNRYVMLRNPNYRDARYPSEGMSGDAEAGLLADAGKRMPFLDKVVWSIEKEPEPRAEKFMQGYYDIPEVNRLDDAFALVKELMDGNGRADEVRSHGIQLNTVHDPVNWYVGFNALDPVVGKGRTPAQDERNRKLRQAISIATNWEEYAAIFFDVYGPAAPAMGPIPPGLFGHREGEAGLDPVTHIWQNGQAVRRPLAQARRLLAEAGYPDGRDAQTGKPLVLYYDVREAGPAGQGRRDWQVKELRQIGIQLEARPTDYNRFQDRVRKGSEQMFFWGWNADYPDPEDFLFLLTTEQGVVKYAGDNESNYSNPEYDRLYLQMKTLPDGPERQQVIDKMLAIVQHDAPWMFGLFPGSVSAAQTWVHNVKSSTVILDSVKYIRVDGRLRAAKIAEWDRPKLWPVLLIALAVFLMIWPAWRFYQRRQWTNGRGALVRPAKRGIAS